MKKVTLVLVMVVAASIFVIGSAQAALIGVSGLLGLPDITSNMTGSYSYDAFSNLFSATSTPFAISFDGITPIPITGDSSYSVGFYVDESGNFTGGIGGDDLVIMGDIDMDGNGTIDFSGILLTAEVTNFGWYDVPAGGDLFDFTFNVTGGALLSYYTAGIGGDYMSSEISNFTGDFDVNFWGTKTKHDTAPLVPEPTSMLLLGIGLIGLAGRKMRKRFTA